MEAFMIRFTAILTAALSLGTVSLAHAQEVTPGPGTLEVTITPVGGTFFTGGNTGSSFGNYTLGGALTYNINRIVGVEAEVEDSLGIAQDLQFAGLSTNQKTPNALTYSGNVMLSVPTHSSFFPYFTVGIGGLTMFQQAALGINSDVSFLTGNVGAGVRWYAPNNRWGLRADYRFLATRSNDTAPAFFGEDARYGNRVYVGVIINAIQ
jgi:opacity protein-like surface antigen